MKTEIRASRRRLAHRDDGKRYVVAGVTQLMKSKTERMLKVDEAGRVWTPRELREEVMDEFERSGTLGTRFAERIGVEYPTFASWVRAEAAQGAG